MRKKGEKITNLLDKLGLTTTTRNLVPDSCTLTGTHDSSLSARLSIEIGFLNSPVCRNWKNTQGVSGFRQELLLTKHATTSHRGENMMIV